MYRVYNEYTIISCIIIIHINNNTYCHMTYIMLFCSLFLSDSNPLAKGQTPQTLTKSNDRDFANCP